MDWIKCSKIIPEPMKLSKVLLIITALILSGCSMNRKPKTVQPDSLPNIVVIHADDLGYGDVSVNEAGTLQTPNIDNLARGGIRFTDGHASSATCTPSRYALLTGTYPWRNKSARILPGTGGLPRGRMRWDSHIHTFWLPRRTG